MENKNSNFLVILCALTIIGSIFTILRGYLYEFISTIGTTHSYYRGWIYIITSIGTISGAILMLQKKYLGLQIYTFFQGIYLVTIFYATFLYSNLNNEYVDIGFLAILISTFFIVPSLIVLICYWLEINRKLLN